MKVNLITVSFDIYPVDYPFLVIKLAMEKEWNNYLLGDISTYLETKSIKADIKYFRIPGYTPEQEYIRMVVCENYAITYTNYSQWVDKTLFEEVYSSNNFSLYRWIK